MDNPNGAALMECQAGHDQCGAEALACFSDDACPGILESDELDVEEGQDMPSPQQLYASGWCAPR